MEMLTYAKSSPASSTATRVARECDFCGREVHRATAVERGQSGGNEPEAIMVCFECAVGVD